MLAHLKITVTMMIKITVTMMIKIKIINQSPLHHLNPSGCNPEFCFAALRSQSFTMGKKRDISTVWCFRPYKPYTYFLWGYDPGNMSSQMSVSTYPLYLLLSWAQFLLCSFSKIRTFCGPILEVLRTECVPFHQQFWLHPLQSYPQ